MATYKSFDEGAPVLTGARGSLVAVLDAVLIKGYGSKGGAGWTKPFPGLNQASYRSQIFGPCFYLSINDNLPNGEAHACGFEEMTGVQTGTKPLPSLIEPFPVTGVRIRKAEAQGATPRRWTSIADNMGFYLWTHGPSSGWTTLAFGDISFLARSLVVTRLRDRIDTGRPVHGILARQCQ